MQKRHVSANSAITILVIGLLAACSSKHPDDPTNGTPRLGGKGSSGGNASQEARSGGNALAGGSLSAGTSGENGAGGQPAGGGSSVGGQPFTGGKPNLGGHVSNGGALGNGGNQADTGPIHASDSASGGKVTAGGSPAMGGILGTGGAVPQGPLAMVSMSPAKDALDVCGDAILSLTFNKPPILKETGKVQIFQGTSAATPVLTLEAPGTLVTRTISGESFKMYPMTVIENTVFVLVPSGTLAYGQSYFVTVEAGLITDNEGTAFKIAGSNEWRFTTKSTKPSASSPTFTVAADGSGDLCTVMGAIDLIPDGNTTQRILNIKNGHYPGLVNILGKHNILLRGEDRSRTNLSHRNTEKMNTNKSYRMAYKVKKANDIVFENLTITNTTPAGGDGVQAEAITIEGNSQRVILHQVDLKSYQDTFMADTGTQVYVKDSKIWGDTDFFWGGGTVYFDTCELMTRESGHQMTNARTPAGVNGFAFVNCKVTREFSDISNTSLGQTHGALDGNVAYINCKMDEHITGWKNLAKRDWEYGNTNLAGTAPKVFNGIQLAPGSPELALTSSPEKWLGWKPVLPAP